MNTRDFETNDADPEDGREQEVVLPDRVTHAVIKGADHPFLFAMGCPTDTTAGGVYIGGGADANIHN